MGGLFFLSGVIDENGTFEFTGLEDKPYLLRVGARDHESVQVEARVGDELDVVLKLLGTLKVVTVHPEGSGPGGSIELVRMPIGQAGIRPVVRPFARSGDTAEIERVAPGTYVVRVEVEDRKWYGLGEARIRPGQSETVTVEMKRAGRLYGTVSHPDGSPAAEAPVSYEAGELWGTRGVKTDAEGRYSLPGIPEGRVVVRSHPFGFARAVKEVELGPGEEREVDLLLTEGASLSLLVTSRGTGEPVEDVGVALAHETGESARYWIKDRQDARTDGEGRLRMVGISPGRYRLSLYSGATRLDMRVLDLTGVEEVEIAVDR